MPTPTCSGSIKVEVVVLSSQPNGSKTKGADVADVREGAVDNKDEKFEDVNDEGMG